jgi:uncharacterized protein
MNVQINQKIIEYFKDKPMVKKVYIFGSYARNEEMPESDVNILTEIDFKNNPLFTGFDFGGMLEDLKEILNKKVMLLSKDGLSESMRTHIQKDLILILEK